MLADASATHDHVCVAYSGGKDSLAVTALAMANFRRVSAVLFVLIPGLRYNEERVAYAMDKWGIHVHQMLSGGVISHLQRGDYCFPGGLPRSLKAWTDPELHAMALGLTGATLLIDGQRKSDYMFRISNAKSVKLPAIHPVEGWNTFDVRAYLKAQDIKLPPSNGGKTTGIGLNARSLLWLHDAYPDDFERIERVFPFIRAVIKREEFYGKEAWKRPKAAAG